MITFTTKQELYDYLNSFNFESVKDVELSSVYFLVEFDDHIEPIYFTHFRDVWFESPCTLHRYQVSVEEFVEGLYEEDSRELAYEHEKIMHRDEYHYEIDCPQCLPFLPDEIKILDVFSDSKCLDWLLERKQGVV